MLRRSVYIHTIHISTRSYKIALLATAGYHAVALKSRSRSLSRARFPMLPRALSCSSYWLAELSAVPAALSLGCTRVQPVNEITRSNLWHQIPNENMIIAANAEYRPATEEDRSSARRATQGTMISSFRSNRSFANRSESSLLPNKEASHNTIADIYIYIRLHVLLK